MPSLCTVARITSVNYQDGLAVKVWRDKVRGLGISTLSLANVPDYTVYGVRNSKSTLLGLAAIYVGDKDVQLLHLVGRDPGREIRSLLICEINKIYDRRIRTNPDPGTEPFYDYIGWRKVGKEYWSK